MSATAIEWATHVWNPFTGCDRVSPGCAHCYALDYAARLKAMGQAKYQADGDPKTSGPGFGFAVHERVLENPERFPAGARVFVNSMSDVFHEDAPFEAIAQLFDQCRLQPQANFLVLTKRAERMAALVPELYDYLVTDILEHDDELGYLPNVWLGTSIENRRFVHRADLLRETPAAVRFVSAEPLLGPLLYDCQAFGGRPDRDRPYQGTQLDDACWYDGFDGPELDLTEIDWLIVGGESGKGHRPMRAEWVRDLRDACLCEAARRPWPGDGGITGPAFFFKQWGGRTPKAGGRELDGRTWDEFPSTERRLTVG